MTEQRHSERNTKQNERSEAARIREAILEGYRDAIQGRTVEYRGSLKQLLKKARG